MNDSILSDDMDQELIDVDQRILRLNHLNEVNKFALNYQINTTRKKYNDLLEIYSSWNALHLSYESSFIFMCLT